MSGDTVVLGKINGVFGVRGQVKVYSYTEPRDNILNYSPWLLKANGDWQERKLEQGQSHGKGIIARLSGCEDRDQALQLVGCQVAVHREQLPEIKAGEYYWSDLMGLTVETLQGVELGQVSHLFETGANDVLVVKGVSEQLIPYIQGQVVKSIDLAERRIVVDWDDEF